MLRIDRFNLPPEQTFQEEPQRPFVNDNNIIMYLDMINEKIVELKGVVQFLDFQV